METCDHIDMFIMYMHIMCILCIWSLGCALFIRIPTNCMHSVILKFSTTRFFVSMDIWDYVWQIHLTQTTST